MGNVTRVVRSEMEYNQMRNAARTLGMNNVSFKAAGAWEDIDAGQSKTFDSAGVDITVRAVGSSFVVDQNGTDTAMRPIDDGVSGTNDGKLIVTFSG